MLCLDSKWITIEFGYSLYIRPVMIATEEAIGLKVSSKYLFYIILSPVGPYYSQGFNPVKIMVSDKYVRVILINIFGGIMRCDVLAQGVVDAAKEIKIEVPLVVRLAGTKFEEGKKILDNSGLEIISASDLSDAAKKVVESIK